MDESPIDEQHLSGQIISVAMGRVESLLAEWTATTAADLDRPIYHYTSAASLLSMLDSQELWCTHFRYLNDPTEVVELRRATLEQHRNDFEVLPEVDLDGRIAVETLGDPDAVRRYMLRAVDDSGDGEHLSSPFISCFSFREDDLSQWRLYGDNGKGIAIGYRLGDVFEEASRRRENDVTGYKLLPVLYGAVAQNRIADAILQSTSEVVAQFQDGRNTGGAAYRTLVVAAAATSFLFRVYGGFAKHQAYEAEAEWRVMMTQVAGTPLRGDARAFVTARGGRLVPTIALKFRSSLIRQLWVGPASDARAAEAIQFLAEHHAGLATNVEITRSELPFVG